MPAGTSSPFGTPCTSHRCATQVGAGLCSACCLGACPLRRLPCLPACQPCLARLPIGQLLGRLLLHCPAFTFASHGATVKSCILTTIALPSFPPPRPACPADGKVQFYVGVQMALTDEEASAEAAAAGGTAAAASAVPPQADPLVLLWQKGVVGSLRVATRALAQHGLRRAAEYQHAPSKAD